MHVSVLLASKQRGPFSMNPLPYHLQPECTKPLTNTESSNSKVTFFPSTTSTRMFFQISHSDWKSVIKLLQFFRTLLYLYY